MKALILTEGGRKIGFGHLTRCLALRDALRLQGMRVTIVAHGDALLRKQFRGQLDAVFNWLSQRARMKELVKEAGVVVIDSYLAPAALYREMSKAVPIPVYHDDYLRLAYPSGIVINGAVGSEKSDYPKTEGRQYLLGAKYALLRKDFWQAPKHRVRRKVRNVLVTFGGMDHAVFIKEMLACLQPKFPDWRFHIVTARPDHDLLRYAVKTKYYSGISASQMKSLILRCDVAVSGGGQTVNELAVCGVPTVGICFAENQRLNIEGWRKQGFLKYAGRIDQAGIFERIEKTLKSLSLPQRRRMGESGQRLVDGKGALRAAKAIADEAFTFCAVKASDRRRIFDWSNDPEARSVSFRPEPILWQEHCAWFKTKLRDPDCFFYKVGLLGKPVGQVRFQRSGRKATISVTLDKKFRGRRLGSPILRLAARKVFREAGISRIDAFVKKTNAASLGVFRRAGFKACGRRTAGGHDAVLLTLRNVRDE